MPKRNSKYCEADLEQALQEIKDGAYIRAVGRKYNIPRGTLQNRVHNRTQKSAFGPSTILTAVEEKKVVEWLVSNQQKGFPRRQEDVQSAVKDFLDTVPRENPFKENLPGDKWYRSFLKRHAELSLRTPEAITDASSKVSENDIRNWFKQIKTYLEEKGFIDILNDPSRVYNGDETNFLMCPKTGKVLATKGSRNVYETDRGQAKENLTVMFSFSAAGSILPPMIVYPYKRMQADILSSIHDGIEWQKSESGWMTAEVFERYVENVLHANLIKANVQFPVIFFVDGHKTHMTYSLSKLCDRLQIVTICLYPNSTRILQPADVSVFKPLKFGWSKEVLNWRRKNIDKKFTRMEFAPILKTTIEKYIKRDAIINGFRACGIYPFDREAIDYSKCLGKNTGGSADKAVHSSMRDLQTINYNRFKEIVGEAKLLQLEQFDPAHFPCTSDFALLYDIYRELVQADVGLNATRTEAPTQNNNPGDILFEFECEDTVSELAQPKQKYVVLHNEPQEKDQEIIETDHNLSIDSMPVILIDSFSMDNFVPITSTEINNECRQNRSEEKIGNDSVDIVSFLQSPSTPQRKGKRKIERKSFIISSSPFRKAEEAKLEKRITLQKVKEEKRIKREENRNKKIEKNKLMVQKRLERERKKEEKSKIAVKKKEEKAFLAARKKEEKEKLAAKKKEEAELAVRKKREKAELARKKSKRGNKENRRPKNFRTQRKRRCESETDHKVPANNKKLRLY